MTEKQKQMMILLQDLILAFVINSTATILNGGFKDAGSYIIGMFQAFSINYVAGLIIPVECVGRAVAGAIGMKDGTLLYKLVRIFIINAIFVTIISFTITMINYGLVPDIVSIWMTTYPILHLVGYITSVLIETPCINLSRTLVCREEQK